MLRVGIAAGEASGDILGAGLIAAIKSKYPDAIFEGIAGPRMIAQGCETLFPMERLSVMGLVEILGRYREGLAIRKQLLHHFLVRPPDVFIGIDAPDFNLGLERKLKQSGIPTVHYVSPSVWAWRQYRIRKIVRCADLMLTLFPFEAEFYREHQMPVRFVGHPLADMIALQADTKEAREQLGLTQDGEIIALLPGSRVNELHYLADDFIQTAVWCLARRPGLHFVAPMANDKVRKMFEQALEKQNVQLPITLLDGHSHEAMAAADVILLASGTAALEALLLKKPMVVAYRLAKISAWLAKHLLKVSHFSLPNLLAGEPLIDELVQEQVNPQNLGSRLLEFLEVPAKAAHMKEAFANIHQSLRKDASKTAAEAVLELIGK